MRSVAAGDAPRLALHLLLPQRVGQVHRRVEPYPLDVLGDAGHAEGSGQMRLAGAQAAHQHRVLRLLGERGARQRHDELAVHRRDLEVEARQIAAHR
jgi:hypothetical protein